jgi:RNA polymerase sigma-70 factor (ECF subfamily)
MSQQTAQPGDRHRANGSGNEFLNGLYVAHGAALAGVVLPAVNGDRQVAEDIVQETMLKAWQHADEVRAMASPRPWLFTVAHRLTIDRWRSRNARPREVVDTPLQYLGVPDHSETALSGILVREALAELTPKYRAALVEVFIRGRSAKEAAAVLGIPLGTLKSRLHGALRALRAALDERGAADHG